ncbi:diguanylate cyclase domain protein, partial [Vibrio parahaemolyticus V-223/04]
LRCFLISTTSSTLTTAWAISVVINCCRNWRFACKTFCT